MVSVMTRNAGIFNGYIRIYVVELGKAAQRQQHLNCNINEGDSLESGEECYRQGTVGRKKQWSEDSAS